MSSTKGKCESCDRERVLESGLCEGCRLEWLAKKPPDELEDMRLVYDGHQPRTPGQVILKNLLDKSPKEFLRMKREAEASYRAGLVKGEEKKESEVVEADEGAERVVELVDQWLEEWDHEQTKQGKA